MCAYWTVGLRETGIAKLLCCLVGDRELALKALTVLEMMSFLVTPALASPPRIQGSMEHSSTRGCNSHICAAVIGLTR